MLSQFTKITGKAHGAVLDEGEDADGKDDMDEEGQPFLATVLEKVRLQQEEMLLVAHQEKMNQNEIISELVTRMDQMENRLIKFSDNPQDVSQDVESQPNSRLRRTGGSPLSSILGRYRSNNESLPGDVFTLMMLSRPCSAAWALGIIVFACQIGLCILIVFDTVHNNNELSTFEFPWREDITTYIGQFISLLFVVLAQGDIFSSLRTLMYLRKNTRWDIILLGKKGGDDPPSPWQWTLHILFPNLMKFFQGLTVFYVAFLVIMKSTTLLDLVKDFTALMVVSELDNMVFDFVAYGYLGESLELKTIDAQDIKIDDIAQRQDGCFRFQKLWLLSMVCGVLASWCYVVVEQMSGIIFERSFPDCVDGSGKSYFDLAWQHDQDGSCYGGPLNSIQCGYEDGHCLDFNMAYPLCRRDEFIDVENEVRNGDCNRTFAIPQCDYDGGDCCPYNIQRTLSFGDGKCHGGIMTTELCGYDNGDCRDFVTTYPLCPLEELAAMNGSATVILGDGICDSQVYNITECGYENGDCV